MEDAAARMAMMARCLAFARETTATTVDATQQGDAWMQQAMEQAEQARQVQSERDRKKREREEADAALMRQYQQNLEIAETRSIPAPVQQMDSKAAEEAVDDVFSLLERRNRSPSPKQASAASAAVGSTGEGEKPASEANRNRSPSVGPHFARMQARRAARNRSPSRRRRRSNSRERGRERDRERDREEKPRGGGGGHKGSTDAHRVPRRLLYSNEGNRRPFQDEGSSKRSRSRSNRRKRGRSNSRKRRDSRSPSSETERKEAIRKKMKQWEGSTTSYLWS